MIAHPERNRSIAQNPDKLSPFIEMGCLLQLTAASVAGKFGSRAESCATKILEAGLAFAIATDAHNQKHRPPILDLGKESAARIIGETEAQKLVYDKPWSLVCSQFD